MSKPNSGSGEKPWGGGYVEPGGSRQIRFWCGRAAAAAALRRARLRMRPQSEPRNKHPDTQSVTHDAPRTHTKTRETYQVAHTRSRTRTKTSYKQQKLYTRCMFHLRPTRTGNGHTVRPSPFSRRCHLYARKSASLPVHSRRMQLALRATPRKPRGASRLMQAMSAWPVKTGRALRPGNVGRRTSMVRYIYIYIYVYIYLYIYRVHI